MMRLRFLVPVLGLSSLIAVACGEDGDTGNAGDAGAGGEAAGGDGPAPGPGGGGGEVTGVGGGCAEDGTGTLTIEVEGLPEGVAPDLLISGTVELAPAEAGDLADVEAGAYTVTAARVFDADPIVRTVFEPSVSVDEFCLGDGGSQTITVSYAKIPSSNKLWMPTALDNELAGYGSFAIADSGITDATVDIDGPGSKAVAFDRDGNLWALGPTVGDAMVARFPAADLGESGTREPDIAFNLPEIGCSPSISSLAFDGAGNLWLSTSCKGPNEGELLRIPAAELEGASDTRSADVAIAGLDVNDGLAFDADGNLWVATLTALVRYDAARLGESDADAPDLSLTITEPTDQAGVAALELAFDANGNLWGSSGNNFIFQVAKANLAGTGDKAVEAKVAIHVDPLAIPDGIAFDDSGNLWANLTGGSFGGFSPTQLSKSNGMGSNIAPTILIESASVADGLPIAFFPAAAGLPLYHSLPEP